MPTRNECVMSNTAMTSQHVTGQVFLSQREANPRAPRRAFPAQAAKQAALHVTPLFLLRRLCVEEAYSLGVLREGAHHDITGSELVLKPGVRE